MKQADLPATLVLKGEQHQDIPGIMATFRVSVKINFMDKFTELQIDQRATKHLPLILRKTVGNSFLQLCNGTRAEHMYTMADHGHPISERTSTWT